MTGWNVVWTFLKQNQPNALISQIYSWNETLHVSDSSSVHHQEFFTVNTAMIYVIQVCWQLASRIRMELQFHPDSPRKLSAKLYDIYHCYVYSEKFLVMDRETARNMHSFIPRLNLRNKFIWLFFLRNLTLCKVTWRSKKLCGRECVPTPRNSQHSSYKPIRGTTVLCLEMLKIPTQVKHVTDRQKIKCWGV